MARIGAELVRRGHRVRLVTGRAFTELATRRGLPMEPLPRAAEVSAVENLHSRSRVLRRWRTGRAELRSVFVTPLAAQYAALRAAIERDTVDAVLVDIAFTGAIPLLLAEQPRPATLVCGLGPLLLSSADTAPFGTGWRPRRGMPYPMMNRFTHGILFRDVQAQLDAILTSLTGRRAPVFLTDWPMLADRILQLTVPAFEYPRRDLPASVVFTGPLPAEEDGADEFPAPLGRRRLHVTQGTWDNTDTNQLIVPTLMALDGRDDLEVIVTTGRAEPLPVVPPANARIVEYCSYAALLPTVDVMITNGGYGGVHAALAHGIPLVVAGDTADKPEVAARVAQAGAGVALHTSRPAPQDIAAAVDRVLNTASYQRAAQRLARDILATRPFDTIERALTAYDHSDSIRSREYPILRSQSPSRRAEECS
ncbi:nucleotide disphospho-sugar-binding domain-containing protein [Nocardia vaccinii]|uniref:nucleotide disphospho-sugar-binding domain-containing protein n=1 Tax=Nocardia vaccinii TaxID=1822 RepID=UPI00082E759E|nr:nucleotide disphospho-sugar-binding domain-containing protein [Nocardia vaccinii]